MSKVAKPAKAEEINIFELLRSTKTESSEEVVQLTADNAKLVTAKDRIIAIICEDYEVTPQFKTQKWDSGSTSILVTKATVDALLTAILA